MDEFSTSDTSSAQCQGVHQSGSTSLLNEAGVRSADWLALDDDVVDGLGASFRTLFERFPIAQAPNESQTEDDLIRPVLQLLGWNASLCQQNLSAQGREDVPDGLLFADQAAKDRANAFAEEWRRYELGLAVVESKRWLQPLDRRSGSRVAEGVAPSTQMLRYLRRVDDGATARTIGVPTAYVYSLTVARFPPAP